MIVMFLVLFGFVGFAQEKLTYSDVVKTNGNTKELYNRALVWFGDAFKSSNNVIQTKILNDSNGVIIGKANIKYNSHVFSGSQKSSGYIDFSIKLMLKNGRYKYEITDFIHNPYDDSYGLGIITVGDEYLNRCTFGTPRSWYNKVLKDIKTQINNKMNFIINSLEDTMNKEIIPDNDNW